MGINDHTGITSLSLEKDPTGRQAGKPGAKLDGDKTPVLRGAVHYFPRALAAVAQLSNRGAEKYSWDGWRSVPDGVNRYGDALMRHLLAEKIDGPWDDGPGGTGLLHATQVAWNALARLELILAELEAQQAAVGFIPKPANDNSGSWRDEVDKMVG